MLRIRWCSSACICAAIVWARLVGVDQCLGAHCRLPGFDASLTRSLATWCLSAGSGLCEQRVREGAALWRKQVQHAYPTFSSPFLLVTPEKNLTRGLARWRRRPQEGRGRRRRHVRAPARGQGERRVKVERQVGRSSPPPPPFLSH